MAGCGLLSSKDVFDGFALVSKFLRYNEIAGVHGNLARRPYFDGKLRRFSPSRNCFVEFSAFTLVEKLVGIEEKITQQTKKSHGNLRNSTSSSSLFTLQDKKFPRNGGNCETNGFCGHNWI